MASKEMKQENKLGYKGNQEIPFKWMLYNRNFWEKVPLNNIFNKLPNNDSIDIILEDVLNMNTGVSYPEITVGSLKNLPELIAIIRKMIKNWKRLKIPQMADHFCNKVYETKCRDFTSPDKCVFKPEEVLELMACTTPIQEKELLKEEFGGKLEGKKSCSQIEPLGWQQVFGLLSTMLWKVVPVELWGSTHNQKKMFTAIKIILKLGCHDKLFVGQIIRGIKHKHFRWARRLRKYCHYTYIIGKIWLWIIQQLVMTVISTAFYVTETKERRNQLLYFRKRIFQGVHNKGISGLLISNFCSFISQSEARELTGGNIDERSLPYLRFLPKVHGVRPIIPAGMSGLTRLTALKCRLLIGEMTKFYNCGSCKVRALSALHNSWHQYVQKVHSSGETKPLYFVRVDIEDAYGSMSHEVLEKLTRIGVSKLPPVLNFGCYTTVNCSQKPVYSKTYILLDDSGQPTKPLFKGGIPLVQNGMAINIKPEQMMPFLIKTITHQIVKVTARQWVRANRGVPQGGSLSSALCELYYSAMCDLYLANFNKDDSIVLRSVDDFLYVTPSSSQAHEFLCRMREGFPYFNCHINERKTVHNLSPGSVQRVVFRGIVLCSESSQILVDSASISSGLPRYSLRLSVYKAHGQLVARRLHQVSLARLPLLVLDPTYTRPAGLVTNIWRAGFMAGARLISLIANVLVPQGTVNVEFIAKTVAKVGGSVCSRVKNAWAQRGKSLPFVQEVIIVVYVGAICTVFGMPYQPSWPKLYGRMKSYVKRLLARVPRVQYCYLPKLPRQLIGK